MPLVLSTEMSLPPLSVTQALPNVSRASADAPLTPPVAYPVEEEMPAPFALSLLTVAPLFATQTLPLPSKAIGPGPCKPPTVKGLSVARVPELVSSSTLDPAVFVSHGSS